jgi:hypothetical protein
MPEKIAEYAWRLWGILGEMDRLNLWEVRAILGESRDFSYEVLLWLAARGKIAYYPMEDQLFISLTEEERTAYRKSSGLKKPAVSTVGAI